MSRTTSIKKGTPSSGPAATATVVDGKKVRFLITDQPNERTLPQYIQLLQENHVAKVVRACEPTYDVAPLQDKGIRVHDLNFEDGSAPPPAVIKKWLDLVESWFIDPRSPDYLGEGQRVAVHCVAGLGRGPVLVAIALIEDGMEPLQAAQYIRDRRKGALNTTQLHWVGSYIKTREKRWNRLHSQSGGTTCHIM